MPSKRDRRTEVMANTVNKCNENIDELCAKMLHNINQGLKNPGFFKKSTTQRDFFGF